MQRRCIIKHERISAAPGQRGVESWDSGLGKANHLRAILENKPGAGPFKLCGRAEAGIDTTLISGICVGKDSLLDAPISSHLEPCLHNTSPTEQRERERLCVFV
jgi:hypothetical protein